MALGFGVGKDCSLGRVVREGLIEGVLFRVRPVKSEGVSHKKRLGMRLGEECSRYRERHSKYSEGGKNLVYLTN